MPLHVLLKYIYLCVHMHRYVCRFHLRRWLLWLRGKSRMCKVNQQARDLGEPVLQVEPEDYVLWNQEAAMLQIQNPLLQNSLLFRGVQTFGSTWVFN